MLRAVAARALKLTRRDRMVDLTTVNVNAGLKRLFIPASIGLFFHVLFSIVDTYYGGEISTEALAALGVTFPLYFILLSVGVGFAGGISALIATQIGKKDYDAARMIFLRALGFMTLASALMTLFGVLFTDALLAIIGVSAELTVVAKAYVLPLYYGSVVMIQIHVVNAGLSAMGRNVPNRNFLIGGFFANIVFNHWFVHGGLGVPPLGVAGIAYSTLLIHLLGILYLMRHIRQTFLWRGARWNDWLPRLHLPYGRRFVGQGAPSTFNMLSIAIYFFIINHYVAIFGDGAVAAYGIGIRIEQLILVPGIGLNIAVATMVAQNHGADAIHRIRVIIRRAFAYSLTIMIGGGLFLLAAGLTFVRFFSQEAEVLYYAEEYLFVAALTLTAYSLIHVSGAVFQGIKKPSISSGINLVGRFTPLPLLYLFISEWGWSSKAIWWVIFGNSWVLGFVFLFAMRWQLHRLRLAHLNPRNAARWHHHHHH